MYENFNLERRGNIENELTILKCLTSIWHHNTLINVFILLYMEVECIYGYY